MNIPFIGRLHFIEYLTLLASLLFLLLELFVRIVTLALPSPIINLFYRSSRRLFNYLSSPSSKRSRNKHKTLVNSIVRASDFLELCELHGYHAEEHVVHTQDGYFLGLHRLAYKKGEDGAEVNAGRGSVQKKVVFCMHGLLMNSEVWVCQTEAERCLAFQLVDQGYDVWFGNNRGNKYSKKSSRFAPTDPEFWAFSIDQFAFSDIPESINYILETTSQKSLAYIGFSQGTAQAFASLSVNPTLNRKIDVFIALAPAMAPPKLASEIVDSLVRASPNFIFLAFGRRAILGSAPMWEAVLYPPIFVRFVDMGTSFLFGWHNKNMSPSQKLAAYPHLYSFTSTKSVVHWFQIIRNRKFQMYDDELQRPFNLSDSAKYYKVAKFPTRNIRTPIVLAYGGSDSLVDIKVMLNELPKHTKAKEIPHYEHLDFLWANDVHEQVFPLVFETLKKYTNPSAPPTPQEPKIFASNSLFPPTPNYAFSSDDETNDTATDTSFLAPQKHSQNISPTTITAPNNTLSRHPIPDLQPVAPESSTTERTSISRPEGWWSSDEVGPTEPNSPDQATRVVPSPLSTNATSDTEMGHSQLPDRSSRGELKASKQGINIGVAKAATGVSIGEPLEGTGTGQGSSPLKKKRVKRPKRDSVGAT
jgi:lysosomal acid lipase/cholesteryl ester hydrolase